MKNLKIVLWFKYIILFLVIIYAFYVNNQDNNSIYNSLEISHTGVVENVSYNDYYLQFNLITDENLIVRYFYKEEHEINLCDGDIVEVNGYMELIYSNNNFNIFNYQNYMNNQGIFYKFVADDIVLLGHKNNIVYFIKKYVNKRIAGINLSKSYVKTFITGDKSDIDSDILSSYQINGIIHLFSISGMHISLLVLILSKILFKCKYKNLYISIFLLIYMVITNFSIGVIRSGLMFILVLINKHFGKKFSNIDILIFLATILILFNTYYIEDVGFLFSFVITYYLIISNEIFDKFKNYYLKVFIISLISNLASLPILLYNFNSINLLSVFINVLFVPLVSIVILPLSFILFITNNTFLDYILYYLLTFMEFLSDLLTDYNIILTFASANLILILVYYLLITLILKNYRKNNHKFIIILLVVIVIHYNNRLFEKNSEIIFLDVGQGDCLLIKYKNNEGVILVDTGGIWNYDLATNVIIPYLDSLGIRKIDYLILSHGDFDHMGAALSLVNNFLVDNVLMNSFSNNSLELTFLNYYDNVEMIDRKSNFSLNGNEFIVYNYPNIDENSDSLIVLFYIDDIKFLTTGDAGINQEMNLIKEIEIKDIDILKVGHHGSITSTDVSFIEYINLDYAVISVGLNNRYNHPVSSVLENLGNSDIYRTDMDGAIKFIINKNIVSIEFA